MMMIIMQAGIISDESKCACGAKGRCKKVSFYQSVTFPFKKIMRLVNDNM